MRMLRLLWARAFRDGGYQITIMYEVRVWHVSAFMEFVC